jgi:hypothetical protein
VRGRGLVRGQHLLAVPVGDPVGVVQGVEVALAEIRRDRDRGAARPVSGEAAAPTRLRMETVTTSSSIPPMTPR